MKKLTCLTLVISLAACLVADAQLLTSGPVETRSSAFNGGTNVVLHSTTNISQIARGYFLDTSPDGSPLAPTLDAVSITVTCASTSGASGNVVVGLTDSPNGHSNNTNSLASVTLPMSGTNVVTVTTSLPLPMPCGRVFIASVANTDSTHDATNLLITWAWRVPHNPGR